MPEETFESTSLPQPLDMLFAVLAVLLIVLGAVLVIANRDSSAYRMPVTPPAQLVAQYNATWHPGYIREG